MKKNIIFSILIGLFVFLIFIPILRLDSTLVIYLWVLIIFIFSGFYLKNKFGWERYLVLLPLNLIVTIIALFLNQSLIPLIFPLLNFLSVLGFELGLSLANRKSRKNWLLGSIIFILLLYTGYFFIPNQAYQMCLVSLEKKKEIPELELFNLDREKIQKENFSGKVLLLNFTFIGCSQCVLKKPYVEMLKNRYLNNPNVKIYDVYLGSTNSETQIKKFLKKNPVNYDVLFDSEDKMANYFEYNGAPHEVLILPNQQIIRVMAGFNSDIKNIYVEKTSEIIDKYISSK